MDLWNHSSYCVGWAWHSLCSHHGHSAQEVTSERHEAWDVQITGQPSEVGRHSSAGSTRSTAYISVEEVHAEKDIIYAVTARIAARWTPIIHVVAISASVKAEVSAESIIAVCIA
jgi:hypothetical protein